MATSSVQLSSGIPVQATAPGSAMPAGSGQGAFATSLLDASSQAAGTAKATPQSALENLTAKFQFKSFTREIAKDKALDPMTQVTSANPLAASAGTENLLVTPPLPFTESALPNQDAAASGNAEQPSSAIADSVVRSLPTEPTTQPASTTSFEASRLVSSQFAGSLSGRIGTTDRAIRTTNVLDSKASTVAMPSELDSENFAQTSVAQTTDSDQVTTIQPEQEGETSNWIDQQDGNVPLFPETIAATMPTPDDPGQATAGKVPAITAEQYSKRDLSPNSAVLTKQPAASTEAPQIADSDDSRRSDARSAPVVRVISRPGASIASPVASFAGPWSVLPRKQTEAANSAGRTLPPQDSAGVSSFSMRDSSNAPVTHSQFEGWPMMRSDVANDSINSSRQPIPRSVPDSANTESSSITSNTQLAPAADSDPPEKSQTDSTGPVTSASSLITSFSGAMERAAQGKTPSAAPQQAPPLRSTATSDSASGVVQVARIIDGMNRSEMHIDMRTQDFGSVEVHTVLRDSQLGLSVGSEKGDLRGFLAPEVPSLQAVIHQQDLRLDTLHFLDQSSQSTAQFSGGADRQPYSQGRSQYQPPIISINDESSEERALQEINVEVKTGLSVHA